MSELKKKIKSLKKKKPEFKRHESTQYSKLGSSWRKPRGSHSKVRQKHKGKGRMPSIGFKTPDEIRGLNPEGFREVRVSNPAEIKNVDPKREMAVIASAVGRKKKLQILKAAEDAGVSVANSLRI